MPRSPQEKRDAILRALPEGTGRSLEEWLALLERQALAKHGERVRWLMAEHGLTRGDAGAVAWKAAAGELSPEEMVDEQYADRERLRPIYERLVTAVRNLGGLVEPRRSHVSFTHDRQFALARPSTRTRLDLGLVLPGREPTGRLRQAGSFGGARTTHRVALTAPADVDDEVKAWLADAFAVAVRSPSAR